MTSLVLPAAIVRRRRLTVLLLVAAGCVSYVDRAALSVGNTAIMAEIHLSYSQMGWLLSTFAWAYLVCQIPMGMLADRLSIRKFLGAGLIVWSCAQIAFGLVSSLSGLFLFRAFLGLGEAPLFLAGTRALVRWFKPEERGGPIGLFNGSATLGPALAPPILLAIMAVGGWRGMSISVGALSVVLACIWFVYYRDPTDLHGPKVASEALPEPEAAAPGNALKDDLGYLLRQRSTWVVSAGFAGVIYITWLYGTWLPAWLERSQNVSASTADLLSALPQICGFFGSLSGGVLCDRLGAHGFIPFEACRRPLVISMLVAAIATGLTALGMGLIPSIMLMALALFAGGVAMTCGWTLGTVIVAEHRVATLEAIQNTGGSFGGALAPAITGILTDHFGSFAPSILVACGVGLICAAIYQFGLNPPTVGRVPKRLSPLNSAN